ncbi:MAG: hypothetical protein R3C11_12455 [Planctomycetaceae bacterium]
MSVLLHIAFSLVLLVIGLRLSFFFSGSETGFYRASFLRLNLDAQGGDKTAAATTLGFRIIRVTLLRQL